MRTGLDFAWSRPSVADILAGGYSFVCRYLSYDTTGKNLTKAEADSYRAAGIDVCSNWEYATGAPLNGHAQGVSDATEGQRQHLACGGDPAAPIYFSVDFDVSQAQQPVVNDYLRGCASVLGLARVGAYGGYWVIKRCFDASVITYGWQTYAWSAGQWDPRAHVRQVLNGINVGGADCDRNEAQKDYFGQWRGDDMTPEQAQQLKDIWWALFNETGELRPPKSLTGKIETIRTAVTAPAPPVAVEFTPAQLAAIAAAAEKGAEAGAPTKEELETAAFEGAQRAEDE